MNNASGVYLVFTWSMVMNNSLNQGTTQQSDIASNVLHYGNLRQLIEGLYKQIDALIFCPT